MERVARIFGSGVRTSGDRTPILFLTTAADETFGQFSPDGKWVAYSSDEVGPARMCTCRVSRPIGTRPRRSASGLFQRPGETNHGGARGGKLYYLAPDLKMMAVPVTVDPTFEPGLPVPLFPTQATTFFPYDVTPDGRFLINTLGGSEPETVPPVTVALNWRGPETDDARCRLSPRRL